MFGACMFCSRPLGTNEAVEHFPVGRRLAFDAARGRLWVVCRRCERWNLTPLEERWEAVETCERLFRDTRVRVSTDQVGLARLREGLELVRIGEPLRPEFAAWRYGDQFGRRRRRAMLYGAGAAIAFGGIVVGGSALGIVGGSVLAQSGNAWNVWLNGRTRVKLRPDDGRVLSLRRPDLLGTRIRFEARAASFGIEVRKGRHREWFEGEEARRMACQIVPALNYAGATREMVLTAVDVIERLGDPERFLAEVSSGEHLLNKMPQPIKLALEMALHEEEERKALAGELWRLERAWKEAEEIAEISDSLLLPDGVDAFVAEHRAGAPPSAGAESPDDEVRR